jgi:nucleotide-binding universal stress UspA family protein
VVRVRQRRERLSPHAARMSDPMAYKTILVHLDQSERVDVRLEVGLRLGRAFDAHLVGLHALSVTPVPGYLVAEAGKTILDRLFKRAERTSLAITPALSVPSVPSAHSNQSFAFKRSGT